MSKTADSNPENNKKLAEELIKAVVEGNLKNAEELLKNQGVDPNTRVKVDISRYQYVSATSVSLLHVAVEIKNPKMVELLLKYKANTEVIDPVGNTVLHNTIRAGDFEMTELLVNYGADVNHFNNERHSHRSFETPLRVAIEEDNTKIAELLLQKGAKHETSGPYGEKPLHAAKSVGMVELLLTHKADPNVENHMRENSTPLHYAATKGSAELAECLLKHGANPNAEKKNSRDEITPLHCAIKKGSLEVVQVLLKYGANPNTPNNKKISPLNIARAEDYKGIAKCLIDAGAVVGRRQETNPKVLATIAPEIFEGMLEEFPIVYKEYQIAKESYKIMYDEPFKSFVKFCHEDKGMMVLDTWSYSSHRIFLQNKQKGAEPSQQEQELLKVIGYPHLGNQHKKASENTTIGKGGQAWGQYAFKEQNEKEEEKSPHF